jgi:flagellar motor switch protein FliN
MPESVEKKLIPAVSDAWNDVAPSLLDCPSSFSLLSSREVSSDGMIGALRLASTWSWGFAAACSGDLSGVLICLFKGEDGEEIDRLVKQPLDGLPKPGGRTLVSNVLEAAAFKLANTESATIVFDPAVYIDLALDEKRLTAIVGNSAEIGTFSLALGEVTDSQALVIYAPNGSLVIAPVPVETLSPTSSTAAAAVVGNSLEENGAPAQVQVQETRGSGELRRLDASPRNIERLLEVELDVVVRFGVTNIPLRDVVRMGVGTMIELNRAVDEPVELLVNGRPLARGEVVVVDGYYGVRITEISPVTDRASIL